MKKLIIPSLLLISILLSGLISFFPLGTTAQETTAPTSEDYEDESWRIIPKECISSSLVKEGEKKECDLDSFVQLFINLANIGKKVLPYLTMIMVIWAGFNLIMAGGNPEKIQSGKKMLTSIFLGIIIILILAWAWSSFVVYVLTCDPARKEETCQGTVFSGYGIWEREWWGGDPGPEQTADQGCCVVNTVGCKNTEVEECNTLEATYHDDLGAGETNFNIRQNCDTMPVCLTLPEVTQCCVPKIEGTCYIVNKNPNVCLDFQTPELTFSDDNNCYSNTLIFSCTDIVIP